MSTLLDDRRTGPDRSAGAGRRAEKGTRESRPRRSRGTATAERANRSRAAQRALDRRERRLGGPVAGERRRIGGVPLVIPVLLLVVGALGLTLYLTTKAAQDSYAIDALRSQNQSLTDRRDDLQRTFDKADAAPELAQKAKDQGMVPAEGAAQVTVGADGRTRVRGTATPADGKALPELNKSPDPTDSIDPAKVDDSQGLGDVAPTVPSTAAPTVPNQPGTGTLAPNVIPKSAATPTPDTARAR